MSRRYGAGASNVTDGLRVVSREALRFVARAGG